MHDEELHVAVPGEESDPRQSPSTWNVQIQVEFILAFYDASTTKQWHRGDPYRLHPVPITGLDVGRVQHRTSAGARHTVNPPFQCCQRGTCAGGGEMHIAGKKLINLHGLRAMAVIVPGRRELNATTGKGTRTRS